MPRGQDRDDEAEADKGNKPARPGGAVRLYWVASMAKKAQSPPKTFEEALQELEQILTDIEGGQVGLEESLVKYERGTFLIQHCRGVLSTAERQIEVLSKSADGGLESAPMEEPQ